jgi:integrase
MASIEKREGSDGKPQYRVKIRLKGAPTQSATFTRKSDANRWAQSTEAAIRDGRHFSTSEARKRTLTQLMDKYEKKVVPLKRNQQTQKGMIAWWRKQLGNRTLAEITPAVISDSRDKLEEEITARGTPRSPATVSKYLRVLSHAFNVAIKDWEWTNSNPVRNVSKPKEPRGRVRYLDDQERHALLDACRSSKSCYLYPIVLLGITTGMRLGEIRSLRWGDINFKENSMLVHQTKNDERRSVSLVNPARETLKELAKVRQIKSDLVFPSRINANQPIDIRKPWESALKRSGVQDFRFHDLRHTTASYLAMSGASLLEIADILGHKNLQMVKRYAHLSDPHTHKVLDSMSKKFLNDA